MALLPPVGRGLSTVHCLGVNFGRTARLRCDVGLYRVVGRDSNVS